MKMQPSFMHDGSLLFIPLSKRKKLITLSILLVMCIIIMGINVPRALCTNSLCKMTYVPCFRIWGHFPLFRVLGFGVIFCCSVL